MTSGSDSGLCRSCSKPRAELFCDSCGALQDVGAIDPFQLMGFALDPDLDTAAIENRYFDLSRRVHPDFFTLADKEEQRLALLASGRLNRAYTLLRNPVSRARHFILLKEGSAAITSCPAPGLFERIMAINEDQQALLASPGDATLTDSLRGHLDFLLAEQDKLGKRLEGAFTLWSADEATSLAAMKEVIGQHQYFQNSIDSIRSTLEPQGD